MLKFSQIHRPFFCFCFGYTTDTDTVTRNCTFGGTTKLLLDFNVLSLLDGKSEVPLHYIGIVHVVISEEKHFVFQ